MLVAFWLEVLGPFTRSVSMKSPEEGAPPMQLSRGLRHNVVAFWDTETTWDEWGNQPDENLRSPEQASNHQAPKRPLTLFCLAWLVRRGSRKGTSSSGRLSRSLVKPGSIVSKPMRIYKIFGEPRKGVVDGLASFRMELAASQRQVLAKLDSELDKAYCKNLHGTSYNPPKSEEKGAVIL